MREFVSYYNKCVRSGYRGRVEVIHGSGSSGRGGAILRELRGYIKKTPGSFDHFTEGDLVGNPGVTILYPKQLLPDFPEPSSSRGVKDSVATSGVREAIWRLCKTPKSQRKIELKLARQFRVREVRAALRDMVAQSHLQEIRAEGEVLFKAT